MAARLPSEVVPFVFWILSYQARQVPSLHVYVCICTICMDVCKHICMYYCMYAKPCIRVYSHNVYTCRYVHIRHVHIYESQMYVCRSSCRSPSNTTGFYDTIIPSSRVTHSLQAFGYVRSNDGVAPQCIFAQSRHGSMANMTSM